MAFASVNQQRLAQPKIIPNFTQGCWKWYLVLGHVLFYYLSTTLLVFRNIYKIIISLVRNLLAVSKMNRFASVVISIGGETTAPFCGQKLELVFFFEGNNL